MLSSKYLFNYRRTDENKILSIKRKGFSLLEIIVSLGLIAVFIIPVSNMVLGTVKINKASEDKQQSIALLQEAIELIKREGQDLPKINNQYININDQFRITRITEENELGEFKVESLNESEYGFNVIGTISEIERIITEPVININEDVDGAIYFSGTDEGEITVVDKPLSTTDCINNIINSGSVLFNKVKGNKVNIESNNGSNMQLSIENYGSGHLHEYNTNAILIVLDNNSTSTKLNLNITNKHQEKDLIIYIYNKNKPASDEDIEKVINTGQGSKKKVIIKLLHSGIEGNKVSRESLYRIQLKAIKNSKEYESMLLDFIK